MSDRQRRARLNDIAQIAGALREPVETPDFTSSILERVHAEKPFIAPQTRRWVPVVRIGAVGLSLVTVFAMTLIVFIKPDLPEQLGAPASVTTELVLSAETGIADKVAGVFDTVKNVGRAADPRQLFAEVSMPAIAAATDPAPTVVPDIPLELSPMQHRPATASILTTPASLPSPMMMASVELPNVADYAAFTNASLAEPRFAADNRTSVPWQRAVMVSQPWVGRSTYVPTITPVARPRLNQDSPVLLKELFPLITGQSVKDELQIR